MKIWEYLLLFFGFCLIVSLGALHSFFGTDGHHWGFILGTALDLIHDRSLFTEVYIQYGVGQPLLLRALSLFVPITLTSIGIMTSIVYGGNLLLIYEIIKKLGNAFLASFFFMIAVLLHTYAIFPWPNYYASFFISAAIWMLIQRYSAKVVIASGVALFLAFLFRSTYLLSITAAALAFFAVSIFDRRLRSRKVIQSLMVFFCCVVAFCAVLAAQGHFTLWYEQSIHSGASRYGLGSHQLLVMLRKAFWPEGFYLPDHIVHTSFVLLFYAAVYFLFRSVIKRKIPEKTETVFFALLGLAGLSQVIMSFEVFRLQNDCLPVLIIAAVLLKEHFKSRKIQVASAAYLLLLVLKFPNASALFPIYEGDLNQYQRTAIPIFRDHFFRPETKKYYEDLAATLCQDERAVVNLTPDSTIPYLCSRPKSALSIPFYSEIFHQDQAINFKGKWVVADSKVDRDLSGLTLIAQVARPSWFRFFGASTVSIYRSPD